MASAQDSKEQARRPSSNKTSIDHQNDQKKSCDYFIALIKFVRFLQRSIATLVLGTALFVFYNLLVIFIFLPSLVIRRIVYVIGRATDPDLGEPITINGTIAARDFSDWNVAPSHSITLVMQLQGQFESIEHLQSYVLKRIVSRPNPTNKDELEYPELRQYVTKKFGFLFFKKDRDFDIKNHVSVYSSPELLPDPENTVVNEERLMDIWTDVVRRPYKRRRSAWEFLLIPNYFPTEITMEEFKDLSSDKRRSVMLLRCHHGYSDGVSIQRLLFLLTDQGVELWNKDFPRHEMTKWHTLKFYLYASLCGPYAFASLLVKGTDIKNPLHPTLSKKTGKYHILKLTLPVEFIKNARKVHNKVSFSSILIASIAGGIRSYFLKKNNCIPVAPVKLSFPLPKQGHTIKLRNEFLCSSIPLPLKQNTATKRVHACEMMLKAVKAGALTPFLTQIVNLFGGLPVEVVRVLTQYAIFTVLYSEIKGPEIPVSFNYDAYHLENMYYCFGLGCDNLGVGFSSCSYNGNIHLVLTVDQSVCKNRDDVGDLMGLIKKEIDELQHGD